MPPKYLDLAVKSAEAGIQKKHGGPFGCVIVKNKRVIAKAHNTVLKTKDPTCHAEMNAIRLATKRLKTIFLERCDVFTTTEPCPMCFAALHWARVRSVTYGTTIEDVRKLGFNELTLPASQIKKLGKSPVRLYKTRSKNAIALLRFWKSLSQRTY